MKKIERKELLMMTGGAVVGGLTGYVLSGAPFLMFQDLAEWTQDQYVPLKGEIKLLQSICQSCTTKCEISVRMVADRAVKVETSNAACPLGQASLQLLYHPERIDKPLKRTGNKGKGRFVPVSWESAMADISGKMNALVKNNKKDAIAAINKDINLSSELLEKLITSTGSTNVFYESSLNALTMSALGGVVDYDFNKADYVLSFGAKLFEGWGVPGAMNKVLAAWPGSGKKLVQVDTNCSRTTSLADEWVPVKAGTEPVLAMGIANYLIKEKKLISAGEGFAKWAQYVYQYDMPTTAKLTGVSEDRIKALAEAFYGARNPMAVAGRGAHGVSSSASEIIAVYALNTLVRSTSVSLKQYTGMGTGKNPAGIDDFIKNGNFELLFVNEADPVYKSVLGKDLAAKMEKAFVVAMMPLINDTALYADYVLPSLTFLETLQSDGQTVLKPYASAKHAGDIIIELAGKVDAAKGAFPWTSYLDAVKQAGNTRGVAGFSFKVDKLKEQLSGFKKQKANAEYPLSLIPVEMPLVGDGDGMAFPYVLKNIDSDSFMLGKMKVLMNKATAKKEGVSEGSSIKIISERGKIGSVKVHITDTIAPDVVAVPLGFGHMAYTKYAQKKGVNPKEIMAADIDPVTGAANWWGTRVKIS
ncbi:MAG: hypothetical protein CVV44_14845 [Spirochaetae bacterium HGW-Spirochaetae-1]|jgi:anaerobic selenocysteine-containing dehydrogenase|nr:MAG: hypothetical protein CVV44_14845 [Spirochaetae bacterium HGW-Spirochaetae-1]